MYEIFNMGIGMVLAVAPEKVAAVKAVLAEQGEPCYEIGRVTIDETPITFKESL